MKPRTKAPKGEQLDDELGGELATYEKVGLFQHSVGKKTAYRYRGVLLRYQRALDGQAPTLESSRQFLAHLREQGFSSSSLRLYRAVLQGFHQWRGEQLVFPVKVPRRQPNYVEPQIIERLLTLAQDSPRDCLILLLMIDAGLRRGEAVNLQVRHVGKDALRFQGKGGRERTIPLTSALNNALKPFCVGKPPSSSVLGVKDKAIYQVVRKYGNLAGKPDLHPHDLRHAFAERLVERGASLRDVQELLGHESLDTTQAYIGVTANHLRGAIDLLDDDYKKPEEQDSETEQWDKFTERWHQLMEMVMRDREASGLSK